MLLGLGHTYTIALLVPSLLPHPTLPSFFFLVRLHCHPELPRLLLYQFIIRHLGLSDIVALSLRR